MVYEKGNSFANAKQFLVARMSEKVIKFWLNDNFHILKFLFPTLVRDLFFIENLH